MKMSQLKIHNNKSKKMCFNFISTFYDNLIIEKNIFILCFFIYEVYTHNFSILLINPN
jgi:hypothetical protein